MSYDNQTSNNMKAAVDQGARNRLGYDSAKLEAQARTIATLLRAEAKPLRVVIVGGAGSGKTSISKALSAYLKIPTFDLDEDIPGGWDKNRKVYEERFAKGLDALWQRVPVSKEWIIEHVRAADPDLLTRFRPNFAILVEQPLSRILDTAVARGESAASMGLKASIGSRQERAIQTRKEARRLFDNALGVKLTHQSPEWRVKLLD